MVFPSGPLFDDGGGTIDTQGAGNRLSTIPEDIRLILALKDSDTD